MFDYEWGNPSAIMLSGQEEGQPQESGPTVGLAPQSFNDHRYFLTPHVASSFSDNQQLVYSQTHNQAIRTFHHSFCDPRDYTGESTYALPHDHSASSAAASFSMEQAGAGTGSYDAVPKTEEIYDLSRIGLNLGGRTYFSAADDDFVSRLYWRSRGGEGGVGVGVGVGALGSCVGRPRCQAEGCNTDLSQGKQYHRRHKVCEFHSKASTVVTAGLTQRFCQQCSRFHLLSEFDNGKRSCRKRLADHNRRRRKSHQSTTLQYSHKQSPELTTPGSPKDWGTRSSSSLTVPLSPPTISLNSFRQRQFQPAGASPSTASSSSNSMLFSSG